MKPFALRFQYAAFFMCRAAKFRRSLLCFKREQGLCIAGPEYALQGFASSPS
jgi:hypothetical protein